MKAKELLVSAGSLLLAGLILVVAGNAVAPAAAANAAAEQQEMMETLLPGSTVFTPEEDTGTDANITAVWKGEGGWIIETTVDGHCRPHPPVDRCGQQWPCNRFGGPGHGGDLRPGPERIDGH